VRNTIFVVDVEAVVDDRTGIPAVAKPPRYRVPRCFERDPIESPARPDWKIANDLRPVRDGIESLDHE
jgi:hypothetical protein